METRCRLPLLLLTAVLMLAGCAPGPAARPHVFVDRAVLSEQTEEAAVFDIGVDVHNSGRTPLELRELRYNFALSGRRVYSGRRSTAMTLAPGEQARISIPAVVRAEEFPAVGHNLHEFTVSGNVIYVPPGRLALVLYDLGLPPTRALFRGTGEIE